MTRRSPSLQGQFLAATLRNLAGSTRWHSVILGIVVLISFSWFTDRLWDVIDNGHWPQASQWVALMSFPLILFWMLYRSRAIEKTSLPEVQCEVIDENSIQKVACLILFLSPPGKDNDLIEALLKDDTKLGTLALSRLEMQGSWRMPLEAIYMHAGRLQQVAVICSADAIQKQDGTWRDFNRFQQLVKHLTGQEQIEVFDAFVESLKHAASASQNNETSLAHFPPESPKACATPKKQGADFEDASDLVTLINWVYQHFYDMKFKDRDIMVDITGGQKVPTIAGAAIALAEGRRFQYVSTRDYKVRHYNVTYRGL